MNKLVILILVFSGFFLPVQLAKANVPIKSEDVASIQINRLSGGSRVFKETDGYEEPVIRKVVEWINTANPVKEATEIVNEKPPIAVLKIKMKNGNVALIEPVYNCLDLNQTKTCTLADSDVIYTRNNQKERLRSVELFDWLLAGWKYESTEPPKDSKELLINDILMILLGPEIEKAVNNYYYAYLTHSPSVYPYQVEIVNVERIGGFRRFHFLITLETTPVVGAHNPVGKDRLTFEIAPTIPGQVKLKNFEHLESYELPPHLQNLIKPKRK
ncbi:DUF3888 domain-containing protein [Neobacillus sp. WH10]|uniref:DUF3888 domain-containing protein n=1 Tax=Neobacillus sp. WH10 TaxID=3047873 RepID=UPI0024C16781|nr:DUF3888 domain-containing protein [Neobacillus sp. WH10]WHY77244.1 DUF3888 domain-containing protein [Neobacillus sp. WH10]